MNQIPKCLDRPTYQKQAGSSNKSSDHFDQQNATSATDLIFASQLEKPLFALDV